MVQETGGEATNPTLPQEQKVYLSQTRKENKPKIQARNTCSPGDTVIPEEHGVANMKTTFHVPGAGDWPAIQDWHPFSRQSHYGLTGG